jgi:hypothetical protein
MARLHLAAFLVAAWCAASGVEVANSNPLKYRYTSGAHLMSTLVLPGLLQIG